MPMQRFESRLAILVQFHFGVCRVAIVHFVIVTTASRSQT